MKQIVFHQADTSYLLKHKTDFRQWVNSCISQENRLLGSISYVFCSDQYLLKINQDHLNHDTYTDIITFDYSEERVLSAEIYISAERVKENAKTHETTFTDEMHRVMIHGVLHLCGYKDKTKEQEREMRAREDYYLSLREF